jgi:hypothetical protein
MVFVVVLALAANVATAKQSKDPIKMFIEAQPAATGDEEKARKERQNVADSTADIVSALKSNESIALVESADQAEVGIAVQSRRQAAIGPKVIAYTMRIGRGSAQCEWKMLGNVWGATAVGFKDALVMWAREHRESIKTVAARRASTGAAGAAGLSDLLESRWTPAIDAAVRELKPMGPTGLTIGVPPLLAMLGDKDEAFRKLAAARLKDLTDQKFGTDRAKWDQWWSAHPAASAKPQDR